MSAAYVLAVDVARMRALTGGVVNECGLGDDHVLYRINRCMWAGRTGHSDVVIGVSPLYGTSLFLDGEMQSAASDEAIYHEHLVHPVLCATAEHNARRVLVVGGGEGATVREVLRWPAASVGAVDWVDIDGDLVNLCRRHLGWADDAVYNDPRLTFYAEDIRHFLTETAASKKYDVVVLDLPDPDVAALHRHAVDEMPLHSPAFWELLRGHLEDGGAVATHVGGVRPGADAATRRSGLVWTSTQASAVGLGNGHAYHAPLPSFHGEWGFWMSVAPENFNALPNGARALDAAAIASAFHWPSYWFS
jgi:spermidine synthase